MKTGIVVNNYDPTFRNKVQVRVQGLHTQKVDGDYIILDDDCPWASPSPQASSMGSSSVPEVGSYVYVEQNDRFEFTYYGQVEVKGAVKQIMSENADCSDKVKVIAFSDDTFNGETTEFRILYVPDTGLIIKCNGHSVCLTKHEGVNIISNTGARIDIDCDNNVNVTSAATINLKCDRINLTEDASEKIILKSKLMEKFNAHTHLCPYGTTSEPIIKIEENDFSDKIKMS